MEVARLQDLVTPLISESKLRKESQEDVGILILGDSADRNLAFDTCLAAAREVSPSLLRLPCMLRSASHQPVQHRGRVECFIAPGLHSDARRASSILCLSWQGTQAKCMSVRRIAGAASRYDRGRWAEF